MLILECTVMAIFKFFCFFFKQIPRGQNITVVLKHSSLIPGCISGGTNRAVANDHNIMLTTELQQLGLCEIWMAFNLKEKTHSCDGELVKSVKLSKP